MDAEQLKEIPLFQGLSPKDREHLGPMVDEVDAKPGRELTRKDALGHEFFVLLEGTVEVRDDERAVRTLAAGEAFGEIALLDGERRTLTAVAMSPVRLGVMTRANLRTAADRYPEVGRRLRDAIAEHRTRDAAASQ